MGQHVPGNNQPLDLGCALVDLVDLGVSEEFFDRVPWWSVYSRSRTAAEERDAEGVRPNGIVVARENGSEREGAAAGGARGGGGGGG